MTILRKLAPGLLVTLALVAVTAATPVSRASAAAAAECVQESTIVQGVEFNGRRLCHYRVAANNFPDGTLQIFVVGTDHAVWTRWITWDGGMSSWRTLGGKVMHGDTQSISMGGTRAVPTVKVIGNEPAGRWWCNTRAVSGAWGGWRVC